MYSAYKLNKQGDNIQPWCTPFPIWNQSVVPCPVLTVASWPTYRFHRMKVRWSGIPISLRIFQFVVVHTVKGFGIVKKAEIDVFLELSCFFDDPVDVDNLISGSSAFSKSSLNIWSSQFMYYWSLAWRILSITLLAWDEWDECNFVVVWPFFDITFLQEWKEKVTFSSPVATAEFSKFAGILSTALSQHHLLGFEIAQLEFQLIYVKS